MQTMASPLQSYNCVFVGISKGMWMIEQVMRFTARLSTTHCLQCLSRVRGCWMGMLAIGLRAARACRTWRCWHVHKGNAIKIIAGDQGTLTKSNIFSDNLLAVVYRCMNASGRLGGPGNWIDPAPMLPVASRATTMSKTANPPATMGAASSGRLVEPTKHISLAG